MSGMYMNRNSPPKVFIRKSALKIFSKFTGEYPCWSGISINHTLAWVLSCKFAAYFQNSFSSWHLLRTCSACIEQNHPKFGHYQNYMKINSFDLLLNLNIFLFKVFLWKPRWAYRICFINVKSKFIYLKSKFISWNQNLFYPIKIYLLHRSLYYEIEIYFMKSKFFYSIEIYFFQSKFTYEI